MSNDRAVELRITGRVQGVFFRAATQEQAQRLGVRGWVRNDPDGSVAAHLEGGAEAVDALVEWCHHGPPFARVEAVQVRSAELEGDAQFTVA